MMIVWLNILAPLAFSLTFSMCFVLFASLLTLSLFSVSVFTTRWSKVEGQGLLHVISRRHSIRFGMPVASQAKGLWYCWSHSKYHVIFFAGTVIASFYWWVFTMSITNAGVPQGSVLRPTLFLVSINHLPDDVLSRIGIYADDTSLYFSLDKVESAGELELDLCCIVEWGDRWLVKFNAT